jgi:hypothetical protein
VLAWQRVAQIQLNLTPDTSVGCNVSVTLAVAGGEVQPIDADTTVQAVIAIGSDAVVNIRAGLCPVRLR